MRAKLRQYTNAEQQPKAALVKGTGLSLAVASGALAFVERNFIVKHVCRHRCTDCFAKLDVANLSSIWPICENFGINVRDLSGEVATTAAFAQQTAIVSLSINDWDVCRKTREETLRRRLQKQSKRRAACHARKQLACSQSVR